MEKLTLGPLDVRRLVKPGTVDANKPPLTVVLLHGFGAPGDDLVGLAAGIDVPPGTVFLFPEALHALEDFISMPMSGSARAWWMIDIARLERAIARGEARDLAAEVPEGLAEARAAVSEMLDAHAKEHPGRVVLGGFSQGAMLSLDLALHQPERELAGLVLLSGTILAEREWASRMSARRGTRVFQSHGDSDPILPFAVAERLRDALVSAGLDVSFHPFAGPHTIPASVLLRLNGWLRALP